MKRGRIILAFLLIPVTATAAWRYCWLPYDCNLRKPTLIRQTERALAIREPMRMTMAARENVRRAAAMLRKCPYDIDLMMLQGANLRAIGRFDEAAESYRAALRIEKRPEIYLELASTEVESGDRTGAIRDFTTCVRFYPFYIAEIADPAVRAEVEKRVFTTR